MIPLPAHKVSQNETNKVAKVHVFQNYLKSCVIPSHSPLDTSIQILILMYHV